MAERDLTPEEIAALPPEVRAALPKQERTATPAELETARIFLPSTGADPDPAEPQEPVGRLQALRLGFGAGSMKQGMDEFGGLLAEKFGGSNLDTPERDKERYRQVRDQIRAEEAQASKERPVLSFLGNVGGDIASDAAVSILSGGAIPVTSQAYQVGSGLLSGLLGSDAELTSDKRTTGSMARAAVDTGIGGGLSYVVPKVANAAGRHLIAPLLRRARSGLESGAIGLGRRVLQGGSDLAGARFKEVPAEAIWEALRSGAIVPFGTTEGAFKRLERAASERGAGYAALLQDLEDMGFKGPEVQQLADSLASRAEEMTRGTITSGAPAGVLRTAARKLENLARGATGTEPTIGPMPETLPLSVAENIKRRAQEEAKYGLLSDTPVNEAKQEVAAQVREAIEDAVEKQGAQFPVGSEERELAEAFKPAKQQLARTLAARNLAEKGNTRVSGRNVVDLRSAIMASLLSGGTMAAGSDPLTGLATGIGTAAALSMANRRLPSTGASALYAASKGTRALAEQAARNPTAAGLPVAKGAATLSREQMARLLNWAFGQPDSEGLAEALRSRKETP